METELPQKNNISEGKTIAIISYFGLIGLVIALFMSKEKKSEFILFHLKQAAGVSLIALCFILICFIVIPASFVLPFLLIIIIPLIGIFNFGILILHIIGILNAVNEKRSHLPLIGKKSEEFFTKYIK